ncbi:MAG: hypothetical protein RIR53_1627 [Bacteroidota bacterium]|jgi:hypothetical protein
MRRIIIGVLGLFLPFQFLTAQPRTGPVAGPECGDAPLRRALGLLFDSTSQGIVVVEVFENMPAYAAGICRGDILLAIDHQPILSLMQAVRQTHDIKAEFVMLDVQRRDMHICRRIGVHDGAPMQAACIRSGGAMAIAIRRVDHTLPEHLAKVLKHSSSHSVDTMIMDLRRWRSNQSEADVRPIELLLALLRRDVDKAVHVVILPPVDQADPSWRMAQRLAEQCAAELWDEPVDAQTSQVAAPTFGFVYGNTGQRRAPAMVPSVQQAPVHWNMADFRTRFPVPSDRAMSHPMMSQHSGMAPIAWGLAGDAWNAIEHVRRRI